MEERIFEKVANGCVVFYEAERMDMFGETFAVGDSVRWDVYSVPVAFPNGELVIPGVGEPDYLCDVTYADWDEIACDVNEYFYLSGTVSRIFVLYEAPTWFRVVAKECRFEERSVADKLDKAATSDGLLATGFVVEITDYSVESAGVTA